MARFSIVKKGYSVDEVEGFINKLLALTEDKLTEQALRINDLKKEVSQLNLEKSELKARENSVSMALSEAIKRADEIERSAEARYAIELNRLRTCRMRFDALVERLFDEPIMRDVIEKFDCGVMKLEDELTLLMKSEFNLDKSAKENPIDEPKPDEFDLQEAISPKETLEEICRELGLI